MSKFLLTSLLLFNFSIASAAEFDWSKLAVNHVVKGQTLKVSRTLFKERYFAEQFCKKLKLNLADMETIHKAGTDSKNPLKQAEFKMDLGKRAIIGVWGWTNEKVVKTADAKVFIYSDVEKAGEFKVNYDQFGEINKLFLSSGVTPYKGLPAICK